MQAPHLLSKLWSQNKISTNQREVVDNGIQDVVVPTIVVKVEVVDIVI
jgi:hypothetical protein